MYRDYSTISPSAKSLLLAKALTDIPYMADACKLLWGDATNGMLSGRMADEMFLMRLIHFEARYKSLTNAMQQTGCNNVLEISSGFSFRGLDVAVNHSGFYYIDTDLPELIEDKTKLVNNLVTEKHLQLKGKLLIAALNALDESAFITLIDQMPHGPVSIINEGLLMYLTTAEKEKLCAIIRKVLLKRGGYWVTADIYVKNKQGYITPNDNFNKFLELHQVEEKKFDNYEQAAHFFAAHGLSVYKKAEPLDHRYLSSLKHINKVLMQTYLQKLGGRVHIRETWTLTAA